MAQPKSQAQAPYPQQQQPAYPQQQPAYPQQQPAYPQQQQSGYPQQHPGFPQQQAPYQQQPVYQQPIGHQQQYVQSQVVAGQTTVYQAAQKSNNLWPNYRSILSRNLGWIQIAVAFLCIIFNSVGIDMQKDRKSPYEVNGAFYAASGIWVSVFYLISGGFAIGAAKHKTTCMIITNLVMSIISAFMGMGLLIPSIIAVSTENQDIYNPYSFESGTTKRPNDVAHRVSLAMGALMLILAFVGIISAITSSGVGCAAVCCGRTKRIAMNQASATQQGNTVAPGQAPPAGQQAPPTFQMVPPAGQQVPPTYQPVPSAGQQAPPTYQPVPSAGQEAPPVFQPGPPAGQQPGGYAAAPPESYNPMYQAGGYGATAPPAEPLAPPAYEDAVAAKEKEA